ncbi:MAG TPA: FAD-dependent thymidylate synthase [Bryobacteraceae bacterium]|nr:FAD-dependent thymidylate synthase [Bryobacteraceae bacterium]
MVPSKTSRVLAVAPMPPEKCAYALARYSRSPDSIRDSLEWVRTHDSSKFLESFYFQYGHGSIADLGHLVLCFEGISELAATEIEDEQVWDGQARSSRYQDFSRSGFVTPPGADESAYAAAARRLLDGYHAIHQRMVEFLSEKLRRPESMKPDMYKRNIAARAFDVARYVLFFGIPTGVGQVTSIRTLERQIRRLKASEYVEVREIAEEIAQALTVPPACVWDPGAAHEPLAPTLARYVDVDEHAAQSRRDLAQWASANLSFSGLPPVDAVHVVRALDIHVDIAATLLYPVCDRPYHELYDMVSGWSAAQRNEVIDLALRSRTRRDDLLRGFRGGLYAFDLLVDIGAYRDLHRHRRCQQFRQEFSGRLGYDTPSALIEAGLQSTYDALMQETFAARSKMQGNSAHYLLPFAAKSRFLFKMDFAEAEYIARLRSGVKGHFSYRAVAWEMKCAMEKIEPELARLIDATPPWVEDPLVR